MLSKSVNNPHLGLSIESLCWIEVEAALKLFDTLLIPLGAQCKEHGPHLPLNTDWLFAEYLARRIVAECRVLAIPTVPLGHYPAFAEYPGSISLGENTFREMILDIIHSFTRHDLRKFYIINTGISTIAPLIEAQHQLANEGTRLEFLDLSNVAKTLRAEIKQQSHGSHADEIETSNMLYIAPNTVRMNLAMPELAPPREGPLTRQQNSETGVFSPTGSWGDPTLATAEKGRAVTEAIVSEMINFLHREFDV